jgi:hypothetical protein
MDNYNFHFFLFLEHTRLKLGTVPVKEIIDPDLGSKLSSYRSGILIKM